MRNSLLLAVAPTATTSQICGQVEACEPLNNNLYKRSVKAGEFSIVNKYMV
jgi:ribonucleotide reductase alpha subunit